MCVYSSWAYLLCDCGGLFLFCVIQACYLRGLNSTHITEEKCRTWLGEWLQISCSLKGKTHPYGYAIKIHRIVFYSKIILE